MFKPQNVIGGYHKTFYYCVAFCFLLLLTFQSRSVDLMYYQYTDSCTFYLFLFYFLHIYTLFIYFVYYIHIYLWFCTFKLQNMILRVMTG